MRNVSLLLSLFLVLTYSCESNIDDGNEYSQDDIRSISYVAPNPGGKPGGGGSGGGSASCGNTEFIAAPSHYLTGFTGYWRSASNSSYACSYPSGSTVFYFQRTSVWGISTGDIVYNNSTGQTPFAGGGRWYNISGRALKVCDSGVVLEIYSCLD